MKLRGEAILYYFVSTYYLYILVYLSYCLSV